MPTILLADDSVTIRKVVELTFGELGYTVLVAGDGDAAMKLLAEQVPDIVLADAVMPGKNGYEVCQAVKADPRWKHLPVLLLAGKFEPFDEIRAKQVGADAHIFKPFQGPALIQAVKSLLEQATVGAPPASPPAAAPAPDPAGVSGESNTAQFAGDLISDDDPFAAPGEEETIPSVVDDQAFDAPAPVSSFVEEPEGSFDLPPLAEPHDFGDVASTDQLGSMPENESEPFPAPPAALPELPPWAMPPPSAASEPVASEPEPAAPEPAAPEPAAPEPAAPEADAFAPVPESNRGAAVAASSAGVAAASAHQAGAGEISIGDFPEDVLDAIVQRVTKKLSEEVVRDIVWQVVPELAELMIRKKLDELG